MFYFILVNVFHVYLNDTLLNCFYFFATTKLKKYIYTAEFRPSGYNCLPSEQMPQKHSKNNAAATHFRYDEKVSAKAKDCQHLIVFAKVKAGLGSVTQRLGSDSQLPFGYCCLSLQPIRDAVAT
jgi:hypothetical protein